MNRFERFEMLMGRDAVSVLKNKKVIVVEEVMKTSSLATLLMQYNHQYGLNMDIQSYAIDDVFVGVGTRKEIKIELGIDVDTVLKNI